MFEMMDVSPILVDSASPLTPASPSSPPTTLEGSNDPSPSPSLSKSSYLPQNTPSTPLAWREFRRRKYNLKTVNDPSLELSSSFIYTYPTPTTPDSFGESCTVVGVGEYSTPLSPRDGFSFSPSPPSPLTFRAVTILSSPHSNMLSYISGSPHTSSRALMSSSSSALIPIPKSEIPSLSLSDPSLANSNSLLSSSSPLPSPTSTHNTTTTNNNTTTSPRTPPISSNNNTTTNGSSPSSPSPIVSTTPTKSKHGETHLNYVDLITQALRTLSKGTGGNIAEHIAKILGTPTSEHRSLHYTVNAILSSPKYRGLFCKEQVLRDEKRSLWRLRQDGEMVDENGVVVVHANSNSSDQEDSTHHSNSPPPSSLYTSSRAVYQTKTRRSKLASLQLQNSSEAANENSPPSNTKRQKTSDPIYIKQTNTTNNNTTTTKLHTSKDGNRSGVSQGLNIVSNHSPSYSVVLPHTNTNTNPLGTEEIDSFPFEGNSNNYNHSTIKMTGDQMELSSSAGITHSSVFATRFHGVTVSSPITINNTNNTNINTNTNYSARNGGKASN